MIRSGLHRQAVVLAVIAAASRSASANDDKSGVSPKTISRPSGPGSLEGLGDAFQPALNTGMARYSVAFQLPAGVAGFTPQLALQFDSGLGYGPAGIGWSFGPGSIRRQTDKGMPRYTDVADPPFGPDRYLGMSGEELVPLSNGYHLAKIEGSFMRCRRAGPGWEAHTKDGARLEFGITSAGRLTDPTETKTYEWYLERRTDTNGNEIRYRYVRPVEADRQVYLSEIRYGPGAEPRANEYVVQLTYEDRPDPRTDYRSGFPVRTSKRLKQVDVRVNQNLIRKYDLRYEADPHCSLLTSVTQYGDDGASALPPTTFQYATFTPPDPELPVSALGSIIGSSGEPGTVVDNPNADFLDINADGLPDLLVTDTGHLAYLNRGVRPDGSGDPVAHWEGPVSIDAAEQRVYDRQLSEGSVHLADMNGDGLADFVVTEEALVEYFPNSGHQSWSASTFMSVDQTPPPAPFGKNGASVRTTDLDFDKGIDIIKSDFGAYSVWFNLGGGTYSAEILVDGAYYNGQFVDFTDAGVDFADMNGDRLNDLVKVTPISVVYFASMGYGRFDQPVEMFLPDRFLDDSANGNLHRAKLTDVNGDGLADLAVERAEGTDLWFWLNRGDGTFAISRVVTDLPASLSAAVRWADINGNGTTDLIYADSSRQQSRIQAVDLAELITGSAHFNAMLGIDNGYGRKTSIEYRSSTAFYLDALAAGTPWTTSVPFPVEVVSRIRTSIGLDLDGYPDEGANGDEYVTDYVYRDGYYDALEKQFRGFAFVKEIRRGDERFGGDRAPTLITRHGFHTGAPDGIDNDHDAATDEFDRWDGREEEPLKGVALWQESTSLPDDSGNDGVFAPASTVFDRTESTWDVRTLCTGSGGPLPDAVGPGYVTGDHYSRVVRYAVQVNSRRTVIERRTESTEHKEIEMRSDFDALGNRLWEWSLGDLSNPDDDVHTAYEYARAEQPWIVGLTSRVTTRANSSTGPFVSETRNYYDGDAFVGLPLGQVGFRGNLHRAEELISADPVPPLVERSSVRGDPRDATGRIDSLRQEFDAYGNPVVVLDPNAALGPDGRPDGTGNERRIEYDAILHKFPLRETIVIGAGRPDLEVSADYQFGFGVPTTVSDFNGNETHYSYDTFGRLHQEILPGDDPAIPTRVHEYDLGDPVSSISTVIHTREGGSPDMETSRYFDGLGRLLGTFEVGGAAMTGVTLYSQRGTPWKAFQPYLGQPFGAAGEWLLPDAAAPATLTRYDATGRVVETLAPPDEHGAAATLRTQYLPLQTVEHDGEDSRESGPHFQTPKTMVLDGLGRLIQLHEVETLSESDFGVFITRYRYALPDLLAEIEDANGNVKYMRYDGLGRKIFMNDCDRGHMTYTYDAAGNVLSTVDANGQQINYAYDGANRLLAEDYLDDGTPLGLSRTPDVTYHYDGPGDDYPWLPNTRGHVAWVEDLTGAEFRGFDARGSLQIAVKRIVDGDGSARDWLAETLSDSLGRSYQTLYPNGGVVRRQFDGRGLLRNIAGFVHAVTYTPSRQKAAITYANGVQTTYSYDPRLRLTRLNTSSGGQVLQDLSYQYDQADNVIAIDDGRGLPDGDPRTQTASFVLDNCYRLIRATGDGYGEIRYDYDRLGNMVKKVSADIPDPDVNLGFMSSGGPMGTAGRIGRASADPPGPHALTSSGAGESAREFDYDANGNLIFNDGDAYLYDFKDRLGRVVKDDHDIRYLYDYSDRRVIKRVDGAQTTYISKLSEIRDGIMMNYVFAGDMRVARVEGPLPPAPVVAQRLHLSAGWNLISFQVDPGATDPADLLADLDGKYTTLYGHDGASYTRFIPGAPGNTLTEIQPTRGYWLRMSEPGELLVEGLPLGDDTTASKGALTLVGLPGMQALAPEEFADRDPDVRAVHAYLGDELGWRSWHKNAPGYLNTLRIMNPGRGYWIESNAPVLSAAMSGGPSVPTFYHADHLGSTNLNTNPAGELQAELAYYPFGMPRYDHAARRTPMFGPFYDFADKERDPETLLQYFEARFCSDRLGRFLSVDPLALRAAPSAPQSPQKTHPYAYAMNNPLRLIDPDGHEPKDKVSFASQVMDMFGAATDFAKEIVQASPKPTQAHPMLVPVAPKLGPAAKAATAFTETLKPVAPVLKVVGQGLGLLGAGMGSYDATKGIINKDPEKVVGGVADTVAAGVGLLGGTVGAAGAGGYAGGTLLAGQIDKHTGHFQRSTAAGHRAEAAMTKATGNETVGTVFGAATAGMETLLPGSSASSVAVLEWIND